MARGIIASFFGMFVMACSGCGGGSTPEQQAQTASPIPRPNIAIIRMESAPVMGRGTSWDTIDVLNPSVIQIGGKLVDYYSGWDGTVWRTGYAISTDNGLTWTKRANPVLGLGAWDMSYIAANGSAIENKGQIFYYFHGMNAAGNANIGLAVSSDGITFNMLPNPVLTQDAPGSWDDLHVADPYVISTSSGYSLYFAADDAKFYSTIGVATSSDGIAWQKKPAPILSVGARGEWDDTGVGEPSVVYAAPYYYMIYTGANDAKQRTLGWAVSSDGINWTKKGQLIPESMREAWDSQVICDPTILPTGNNDGTYYVWFGGGDRPEGAQGLDGQIGRMTIKLN